MRQLSLQQISAFVPARALLPVACLLLPAAALAFDAGGDELSDGELSGVTGQEGISVDIEMRFNTDASGVPLASLSNCSGLSNPCRMALTFNNRPNEWLVLKDWYASAYIPKVYLDKTNAPPATTSYKDLTRFQSAAGDCLLGSGHAGACVDADINNQPAMKLSAPGNATTFENDIFLNVYIGRVAVEYGATGYLNDANGSFLGFQIRDTSVSSPQAKIDVDGEINLFGF